MRPRAFKHAFASVLLFAATMAAQEPRSMDDPLFAIRYNPRTVRFESLPASLLKQCKDLKGRYNGAWVYGYARSADAEYFIVSGLMEGFNEEVGKPDGHFYPDETGLIIAMSGSICAMQAQDDLVWLKNDPIWNISETTMNNLTADIFRRYSDAFEGKSKFLKQIPADRNYLQPVLRSRLEMFEKQPR